MPSVQTVHIKSLHFFVQIKYLVNTLIECQQADRWWKASKLMTLNSPFFLCRVSLNTPGLYAFILSNNKPVPQTKTFACSIPYRSDTYKLCVNGKEEACISKEGIDKFVKRSLTRFSSPILSAPRDSAGNWWSWQWSMRHRKTPN